jgi:hypothetical protein
VYQSFGFGWNGMASLVFDNSMCWWSWQVKTADGQENDGRQTLPADVLALAQFTRSSTPAKRICYTTTRPSDMSTPYQKMIENGVDFGAPDKRSMKLINSLSITLLYLALFAGLLGRFPLKLPQVFFSLLQCLVSHFFKFTMMCIWPSPLLFIH